MTIRSFFSQAKAKVKHRLAKIINNKFHSDPYKRQLGPKTCIEVIVPEQNSEPASYNSSTRVERTETRHNAHVKHTNKYRLSVNTDSFRVPFYATPNIEQNFPEPVQLPKPNLFILQQIAPQENDMTLTQLLMERARTLGDIESHYLPERWHDNHPSPFQSRIEDDVLFYCPELDNHLVNPETRIYDMDAPIILLAPPEIEEI
ncbi:hypothetical protein COEREDRAFT_9185 [Coemansia reversa NRRL 1564]|uniref:Uncharacterized protein n=1 Tax=Coemansia reversa (strain ATCC 12441 / NRRL 1564) TaxID=763665 RepID=A0A2G5B9M4_COERN|nr:hypothetical protein COEREDRAFT_9185 [Coemansia reversa NRRL 1564]|eukprot:PIA15719.1 hypothetical protein COEREDRAFT_9185 [Coemansia reversa NRRL 1564]